MTVYYKKIDHTNSSDEEETVTTITSSREEPKSIYSIILFSMTNQGVLTVYRETEIIAEIPTGAGSFDVPLEIPLEIDLPVGQTLTLTLKNKTTGTNAAIVGVIKYSIGR